MFGYQIPTVIQWGFENQLYPDFKWSKIGQILCWYVQFLNARFSNGLSQDCFIYKHNFSSYMLPYASFG